MTKPEVSKDYTFFTLVTKEAKDSILDYNLLHNHEKLKISVTCDQDANNPSELRINTTLVVNNLPQKEDGIPIRHSENH